MCLQFGIYYDNKEPSLSLLMNDADKWCLSKQEPHDRSVLFPYCHYLFSSSSRLQLSRTGDPLGLSCFRSGRWRCSSPWSQSPSSPSSWSIYSTPTPLRRTRTTSCASSTFRMMKLRLVLISGFYKIRLDQIRSGQIISDHYFIQSNQYFVFQILILLS